MTALNNSSEMNGKASHYAAKPETEVFEVVGTIKWYDVQKGYGFVTQDNGQEDVLLHVTCLRAGGYSIVYEGARIHLEVINRPRGLQAFRIISMDETTAIKPFNKSEAHRTGVVAFTDWEPATVGWFNRLKGYGFLSRNGSNTPNVFIHMETLRMSNLIELRPNQEVEVKIGSGPKGLVAVEIRAAS